jgi:predicted  nucleic acid-binding Zn ribbon protein
MSSFDSGLSKQGRKVAAKISEVSGIKTYYFLSNVAKQKKEIDINRPCPSCGGAWHLEKEKFGYFRYQCDICLLMSAYSNYHS